MFESSLEKKMNEKIIKFQNEALSIENEDLKKRLEVGTAQITSIKKEFSETIQVAKQANMSSNYNEQYSRKNNIKVFNFPRREKQNLRQDFY